MWLWCDSQSYVFGKHSDWVYECTNWRDGPAKRLMTEVKIRWTWWHSNTQSLTLSVSLSFSLCMRFIPFTQLDLFSSIKSKTMRRVYCRLYDMQIKSVRENEMGVQRKCNFIHLYHHSNSENMWVSVSITLIKIGCQSKRIKQCIVVFPVGCCGFCSCFFSHKWIQKNNDILTMNSQKTTYTTSQRTSVHPRAFAGLNSCSSLFSSGELKQFVMFFKKCDGPRSLKYTGFGEQHTQNKSVSP